MKLVIPYYSDETATAWPSTIGPYVEGQSSATKEQLLNLARELEVPEVAIEDTDDEILDPADILNAIHNDAFIFFDKIAIVDGQFAEALDKISSHLLEHSFDDSSCYAAGESYRVILIAIADETFDIL